MLLTSKPVRRRSFLRIAAGSGALLAANRSLPVFAGPAVVDPSGLTQHDQKTLVRMIQLLFPHEGLSVRVYEEAGEFLAGRHAGNQETLLLLKTGIQILDDDDDRPWIDRPAGEQLARLHEIEQTDFFHFMRHNAIEYLYRDPRVWSMLGYEGPSISFGGYLNRGFDDIDWLPGT